MKTHRVPSHKEMGYREPDGVNPDVKIACSDCGLFGFKDGQPGCDRWAESPEVQCQKRYGGVQCEKTSGHKPGCERRWMSADGSTWIGTICLDRPSYMHVKGTVAPDD